jgi:hypothetical protein
MEADLVRCNPTLGVRKIKYPTVGHHRWTPDKIEQFKASHPIGSRAHLALALMLYTTGAGRTGSDSVRSTSGTVASIPTSEKRASHSSTLISPRILNCSLPSRQRHRGHLTLLITAHGKPSRLSRDTVEDLRDMDEADVEPDPRGAALLVHQARHVCGNDVLGAGAVMISDFVVTHLGRYAAEATAFIRSTWREFDAAQIAARATACRPTISNLASFCQNGFVTTKSCASNNLHLISGAAAREPKRVLDRVPTIPTSSKPGRMEFSQRTGCGLILDRNSRN